MAVDKDFVVRNGLQINENLIYVLSHLIINETKYLENFKSNFHFTEFFILIYQFQILNLNFLFLIHLLSFIYLLYHYIFIFLYLIIS